MNTMPSVPQVSVIIPVYNTGPYLRRCLDSVCGQTLRDSEIICVDDGSTDDCPAILNAHAAVDARIRVISHTGNRGCAAARNTGMDAAHGRYIHFMDSDDWIDEGYLEELVRIAEQEHIDLVMNSHILLEQEDGTTVRFEPGNFDAAIGFATTGYVDCHTNIGNFTYSNCCCLYRKDYLERISVRFPEGLDYTDNFFHIATFLPQNKIYITNNNAYHYVQHSDSICGKNSTGMHTYDIIKVYKIIFDYFKRNGFIEICKLNFYELIKYICRFADKDTAFSKIYNLFLHIKEDIMNHQYFYSESELYFFNSVMRSKIYMYFEYLYFKKNSQLNVFLIKRRQKIKTYYTPKKILNELRRHVKNKNVIQHCMNKY